VLIVGSDGQGRWAATDSNGVGVIEDGCLGFVSERAPPRYECVFCGATLTLDLNLAYTVMVVEAFAAIFDVGDSAGATVGKAMSPTLEISATSKFPLGIALASPLKRVAASSVEMGQSKPCFCSSARTCLPTRELAIVKHRSASERPAITPTSVWKAPERKSMSTR
jgi:hypothetical protein